MLFLVVGGLINWKLFFEVSLQPRVLAAGVDSQKVDDLFTDKTELADKRRRLA
jgi:hypothetical protein